MYPYLWERIDRNCELENITFHDLVTVDLLFCIAINIYVVACQALPGFPLLTLVLRAWVGYHDYTCIPGWRLPCLTD